MNPGFQFIRQRRVHHAVLLDAGFSTESFRNENHAEMAFPIRPRAGVARVMVRLVDNLQ